MKNEQEEKLSRVRGLLEEAGAGAVRFRGTDWFAWSTCGGSNAVLLSSDVGVAEVLITRSEAWVLTDEIEAERLRDEELPVGFPLAVHP